MFSKLTNQRCWIIVPIYNEADSLSDLVPSILKVCSNVVFVDDGSTDDTNRILRGFPVTILKHQSNLGQGAAIRIGLRYAITKGAEILVTMDSDGQMNPTDIPRLCEVLQKNNWDIVIGSRFKSQNGKIQDIPFIRKWILITGAKLINFLWRWQLTDCQNGYRAMNKRAAKIIIPSQNRMAHALEILYHIKSNNLNLGEVPVNISYTHYSLSKGQGLSNVLNIVWDVFFSLYRNKSYAISL